MTAKQDQILTLMGMVNEVKDDVRQVHSTVEMQQQQLNTISFAVSDLTDDVRDIKDGPMYSIEKYLQKQVIKVGGIGGLLMLILAITGFQI
jgi:hypothetical protein